MMMLTASGSDGVWRRPPSASARRSHTPGKGARTLSGTSRDGDITHRHKHSQALHSTRARAACAPEKPRRGRQSAARRRRLFNAHTRSLKRLVPRTRQHTDIAIRPSQRGLIKRSGLPQKTRRTGSTSLCVLCPLPSNPEVQLLPTKETKLTVASQRSIASIREGRSASLELACVRFARARWPPREKGV